MSVIFLVDFADVSITTPALLFSASAFLLLSFTNRYLTIASRIRSLCDDYRENPKPHIENQIRILDRRVDFLRYMQVIIILSLFAAVLSMFLFFLKMYVEGVLVFGVSLLLLCASLLATMYEINISSHALKINIAESLLIGSARQKEAEAESEAKK